MRSTRSLRASSFALCALALLPSCAPAAHEPAVEHPAPPPAVPTPAKTLLALSKANHTLAIVDARTLQVIARVPVGPDPHEVTALPDGKTAFVSNAGGGRFHEIDVIDLVGQRALPSFDTGALLGPHGLSPVGGKVWFTAEGAKAIGRIDPASMKVDLILGTGQNRTHMVYVTPDEKHVYATNVDSGTVSLFDDVVLPPPMPPPGAPPMGAPPGGGPPGGGPPHPREDWVQTVLPASKGSEGFDVSPDGRELWTAAAQDGTITVIDVPGEKVAATIDAKVQGANRLKFTPDGAYALVSSLRGGDLVVFDAHARKEVKRIPVGHGAAGILVDPDGSRAFVGCTPDDSVAVIDLKKLEVSGRVDVGGKPDGLAWAVRP